MTLPTWEEPVRYTLSNSANLPVNIVVNGFSIRDTVLEVLKKYKQEGKIYDDELEEVANEIEQAFAVKLKLIQGMIPG
jgi:ribosome recycling factor